MILETKFNVRDKVKIVDLDKIGRILAIYYSETGIQYSTRYYDGTSFNTTYFYQEELEIHTDKKEIKGFKLEKEEKV